MVSRFFGPLANSAFGVQIDFAPEPERDTDRLPW